jgi:hypothetical protein
MNRAHVVMREYMNIIRVTPRVSRNHVQIGMR